MTSSLTRRSWLAGMLARPSLRVNRLEVIPVRATARTVWIFVRLGTDQGLTGLGEASDAYSFNNTSKEQLAALETELRAFYSLVEGRSPLDVQSYRERGWARASGGRIPSATAFSAIEQALWDLTGQALGVPVADLLGGPLRNSLLMYANVNRMTQPRTPEGFARSVETAVGEGYRSVKGAPFDGFPRKGSMEEMDRATEQGIACIEAMRKAAGPDIEILIDCHSNFDVARAKAVAARLEPVNLGWYEEPVPPERLAETVTIKKGIRQPMAGGEMLFGVKGFAPLCRTRAVDVIMPDVKHCGGVLEMSRIAAVAEAEDTMVAPHNPSGPVATAASVQICAAMRNFRILELQWGEVPWRGELVNPPEVFKAGRIEVPSRPGLGISLNDKLAAAHPL